jgi:hypothetical protein
MRRLTAEDYMECIGEVKAELAEQEPKDQEAVEVSQAVYDGLEAVRDTGLTNMLDYRTVMRLAGNLGYDDTVEWMQNHQEQYIKGFIRGFVPKKSDGSL